MTAGGETVCGAAGGADVFTGCSRSGGREIGDPEAADATFAVCTASGTLPRAATGSSLSEDGSAEPEPGSFEPPCPERRSRTVSASSGSMVLECVFLSSTPSSGSKSRMTPGFTSNSRASSLILIFDIIVAAGPSAGASSSRKSEPLLQDDVKLPFFADVRRLG